MDETVRYLLSLRAIRERAAIVGKAAEAGNLSHFDFHAEKLDSVADFVTSVIKRDFGPDKYDTIPPHGRWQHFEIGGVPRITELVKHWNSQGVDKVEVTRRLIDLFTVSVLLDAGAGDEWSYVDPGTNQKYTRSEGIAVASLHMFTALMFNGAGDRVPAVDGKGLESLTGEALYKGFQCTKDNPMVGVDSRAELLQRLGTSLLTNSKVYGVRGRPGNVVDHMLQTSVDSKIDILAFWDVLQHLLIPIWPKNRVVISGSPIGDAWPLSSLKKAASTDDVASSVQPFHKLTQWITYSLMVPFERILGLKWVNAEAMTGLPEYRNGGIFTDLGALNLKPEALKRGQEASGQELPLFDASDDVIVEWRSMTVVLLDQVHKMIQESLGVKLSLAQVLEAGTWKSGRELAAQRRPETRSSPILVVSDGTVF